MSQPQYYMIQCSSSSGNAAAAYKPNFATSCPSNLFAFCAQQVGSGAITAAAPATIGGSCKAVVCPAGQQFNPATNQCAPE